MKNGHVKVFSVFLLKIWRILGKMCFSTVSSSDFCWFFVFRCQFFDITKLKLKKPGPKLSNLKIHKGIEITKEEREHWT
jgi:hypothetical protein